MTDTAGTRPTVVAENGATDQAAETSLGLGAAITAGLRQAMADDPSVLIMGEDVGQLGGVFRVTDSLATDFGEDRVIDTPLAESGLVGTAVGLAVRGYRPVCEIQFDGFVYPGFDQIVSQLAKLRSRSGGTLPMPVVVRIPYGGGIGAVEHHSESNEAYFAHTAGLRVVVCAHPADAHRMIQQAIRSDDPVVFYEPKRRYWEKGPVRLGPVGSRSDDPPLHRAQVMRSGSDVTVIAYGAILRVALDAARAAEADGRSLEVIDLRSLSPLDIATLVESVQRTGRAVVVHEAPGFLGMGAEIVAQLTERCFYHLEAPVQRVTGYDIPYPPGRVEQDFLPDLDRVLDAVDRSLEY